MRRSAGRLTAAGVAILISTAFVTVTLLAGGVISGTTHDHGRGGYARADLVVSTADDERTFTADDIAAVGAVHGIKTRPAADGLVGRPAQRRQGGYQTFARSRADPRLSPLELTDGAWPASEGEVALPTGVAERLGVGLGDTVTLKRTLYPDGSGRGPAEDPEADPAAEARRAEGGHREADGDRPRRRPATAPTPPSAEPPPSRPPRSTPGSPPSPTRARSPSCSSRSTPRSTAAASRRPSSGARRGHPGADGGVSVETTEESRPRRPPSRPAARTSSSSCSS